MNAVRMNGRSRQLMHVSALLDRSEEALEAPVQRILVEGGHGRRLPHVAVQVNRTGGSARLAGRRGQRNGAEDVRLELPGLEGRLGGNPARANVVTLAEASHVHRPA